jgi:topoisomerase-4 subunit A
MHFPENMVSLEKWIPEKPISAIYYNGIKERYFVKRFLAGQQNNDQKFIPDGSKIQLEMISTDWKPVIELSFSKTAKFSRENEIKNLEDHISIKGIKAIGNQLSSFKIKNINQLDPIEYSPPEIQSSSEMQVESEEIILNKDDFKDEKKLNEGQTEFKF